MDLDKAIEVAMTTEYVPGVCEQAEASEVLAKEVKRLKAVVDKLPDLVEVVENIDDEGYPAWYVGIEFTPSHQLYSKCLNEQHAEAVRDRLREGVQRFIKREAAEAAEAARTEVGG